MKKFRFLLLFGLGGVLYGCGKSGFEVDGSLSQKRTDEVGQTDAASSRQPPTGSVAPATGGSSLSNGNGGNSSVAGGGGAIAGGGGTITGGSATTNSVANPLNPGVVIIAPGDLVPPVVDSFQIPTIVSSLSVGIDALTGSDNVGIAGFLITESADKPSQTDSRWSLSRPTVYRIQSMPIGREGLVSKTLWAWTMDAAGNISNSVAAQTSVPLQMTGEVAGDRMAPYIYKFEVPSSNGGLNLPVAGEGYDDIGITGYLVTETNLTPSLSDPGWTPGAPTQYHFGTPGYKVLHLWAKDASGKVSSPSVARTYVYLDTLSDPLVLILVRDYLYSDNVISGSIARYVSQLASKGYAGAQVQSVAKLSGSAMRQLLINTRNATQRKFAGVVLVGDINQPTYYHQNDFHNTSAVFPADLALTALDANINYSPGDGRFSDISVDLFPKIWMGRVDFSRNSLFGNELDSTRNYLAKLLNDQSVKLSSPFIGKALLFTERDFMSGAMNSLEGMTTTSIVYPNISQSSYVNSINLPYEFLHSMVHSAPHFHQFSQFNLYASSKFLVETRLINLFACSAALPSSPSLLEPYMLSGTRGGIAVIGSTKTGSMNAGQRDFYKSLFTQQINLGEAFVAWQRKNIASDDLQAWHMGMTINGDPTAAPSY
jgi:hypothetical protein